MSDLQHFSKWISLRIVQVYDWPRAMSYFIHVKASVTAACQCVLWQFHITDNPKANVWAKLNIIWLKKRGAKATFSRFLGYNNAYFVEIAWRKTRGEFFNSSWSESTSLYGTSLKSDGLVEHKQQVTRTTGSPSSTCDPYVMLRQ